MPSQQIQILLVESDPVDARRLAQMLRANSDSAARTSSARRSVICRMAGPT